jgi:serine/threonine protein kinase
MDNQKIDEETALLLIYQLLKGIQHIHDNNYIHCDFKPCNCLINSKTLELKVCDFGCALPKNTYLNRGHIGTRWYRAPELLINQEIFDCKVDIWAVRCILFEMFNGRPIFPGKWSFDQLSLIQRFFGSISKENKGIARLNCLKVEKLIPNVNRHICDFIQKLISLDPADRPTAFEALESRIFSKIRSAEQIYNENNEQIPFPVYYRAKFQNIVKSQLPLLKTKTFGRPRRDDEKTDHKQIRVIKSKSLSTKFAGKTKKIIYRV